MQTNPNRKRKKDAIHGSLFGVRQAMSISEGRDETTVRLDRQYWKVHMNKADLPTQLKSENLFFLTLKLQEGTSYSL